MTLAPDATGIFEAARRACPADVAASLGVVLRPQGLGRWRGACPLCGGEADSTRFSVTGRAWRCYRCGEWGDAIALLAAGRGVSKLEAARALAGAPDRPRAAPAKAQPRRAARPPASTVNRAQSLWGQGICAAGTLVEAWFDSRAIDADAAPAREALRRLRFHPAAPTGPTGPDVGDKDRVHPATAPAMLALIVAPGASAAEDRAVGLQVTFLAADGRGKARLRFGDGRDAPTRKIYGRVAGAAVQLSPWTAPADDMARPLLVGEGIETTLSMAILDRRWPLRLAAALGLDNLQGGALRVGPPGHEGVDLMAPFPDPDRRPFVLPPERVALGEVTIGVDADMSPIALSVRTVGPRGPRTERRLVSALERAELCARLACAHWRAAGAPAVRSIRPRLGLDFNDALRERP